MNSLTYKHIGFILLYIALLMPLTSLLADEPIPVIRTGTGVTVISPEQLEALNLQAPQSTEDEILSRIGENYYSSSISTRSLPSK